MPPRRPAPRRSKPGAAVLKEVPSLYPTETQFQDPIGYLSSPAVAALGARYGMVKLIPPASFTPPLSINKHKFRFVPRLQRLKELNLLNRCRMFFHRQLANFNKMNMLPLPDDTFELVNSFKLHYYDFFIECVKYYHNDMHSLHEDIIDEDDEAWTHLSTKFPELEVARLQSFYRRNLLRYFNFLSKKSEFTRTAVQENHISLLNLQHLDEEKSEDEEEAEEEDDDVDEPCLVCHQFSDPENTLLCDSCDKPYHRYCLNPPLSKIPEDSWCCDSCVVGNGYYGFQDAPVEYSLSDFSNLSDDFDNHFFGDDKPEEIEELEKIFWDLVNNTDNDVNINYGADIHNLRKGEVSGFPTDDYTPPDLNISRGQYRSYINHPMNLNNLPFDKGSLLNYLDVDISGMTIPWIYIGNTFSTFCWHVEDQYTLSANYQHFGATKKWYSIPSKNAEVFEKFMENLAPDLFAKQPDILHQLITLVSPYKLMQNGIECFTANQQPGEYIITYPRVYHAGFNAGYNFNEAVNFTMTEWLEFGVLASKNYQDSAVKSSVFDIWELMVSIVEDFLEDDDDHKDAMSTAKDEAALVRRCVKGLKPRLESEYSVQSTILDSLDLKAERYQPLKKSKTVVYDASEEEKKFDEDGIACVKCKGFCTFAFVKHYIPLKLTTYLPTPQSSPQSVEEDDDKSRRHSKRIKLLLTSESYETQVLCLEDYLKLEDANGVKDKLFVMRELDEVKSLIQRAEMKLAKC